MHRIFASLVPYRLTRCGLALFVIVTIAIPVPAASIGVNFYSGDASLPTTSTAGVVPQQNWNNEASLNGGPAALVDSSGASLPTTVTWSAGTGGSTNDILFGGSNNVLLNNYLNGFISAGTPAVASVTVDAIPYSQYDLYVYAEHVHASNALSSYIVNLDFNTAQQLLVAGAGFYDTNGFVLATGTTSGDYLVFRGLTAASLTLVSGIDVTDSPINGIQLVPVPEPATVALLVSAFSMLGAFRVLHGRDKEPNVGVGLLGFDEFRSVATRFGSSARWHVRRAEKRTFVTATGSSV
jgi:hypothetical protein